MLTVLNTLRVALANRRAYRQTIDQIAEINARDLADMNIDRETSIRAAHREVDGVAR